MTSCMCYLHVISRDISTVNYYPKAIRVGVHICSVSSIHYGKGGGGGGQNGVCKKLGGLHLMRECEARP